MKPLQLFTLSCMLLGSMFFLTGCQEDEQPLDLSSQENIVSQDLTTKTIEDFGESDITSVEYVESLVHQIWNDKSDGIITMDELHTIGSLESNDLLLALMVTEEFESLEEYLIDKDYATYGAWRTDDGSIAIKYPLDHPRYDPSTVPVLPDFAELSGNMSKDMYMDLLDEMKGYVTGDALEALEKKRSCCGEDQ